MAYHTGTIWQWLAGPFISSALKFGYIDKAWELTVNMQTQILDMWGAGALAELADAYTDKGGNTILSGTFSQAWSNAEYLRVFYQEFCGVKPELKIFGDSKIETYCEFNPVLPVNLEYVSFNAGLAGKNFSVTYKHTGNSIEKKIVCL